MEGDAVYLADPVAIEEFQSTPSVWRETAQSIAINSDYKISIHSLRMEGDIFRNKNRTRTAYFNPLPPYGGRQHYAALVLVSADISIHSLRMEGDQHKKLQKSGKSSFQSTPSAWRETFHGAACGENRSISIHSLRMEGDLDLHIT